MSVRGFVSVAVAVVFSALLAGPSSAEDFVWQIPHARSLPSGELEYTPQPFQFTAGDTVRYIDFEGGNDANPGTRTQPWKHHPWDSNAGGNAARHNGPTTYVFKGGVIYRGQLEPGRDQGTPEELTRLTRDPSWGDGPATLQGSDVVTGWQKGAHPRMPAGEKVWYVDLNYLPRNAWVVDADGQVTRLHLARDPNWTEPDPDDVMSEWYRWDNPRWWTGANKTRVDGKQLHYCIDKDVLTGDAEDYVGGTVWSEWAYVMGSPYPSIIHTYDAEKKAITFHGPWTHQASENVVENNRYFLEDRPQWLDSAGEFWVEKKGRGGRMYARMPGDASPQDFTVEAARRIYVIKADQLNHVHISGLRFRFTNLVWEYNMPAWWTPDNRPGVISLEGGGDDIQVDHCTFQHVHMPVRIVAAEEIGRNETGKPIGTVRITDNLVEHTDHGAFSVSNHVGANPMREAGPVQHVDVLRNKLFRIGWRALPGGHGHAISLGRPKTAHVAGNFLHRIAGWGISVTGGKSGGLYEVPMARYLIHHNRIEDPLLKTCDWGGIETWQGGPHYVWNNVSINPRGLRFWAWRPDKKEGTPCFGHAYYMDGSFKNYMFNNIAVGKSNELGSQLANESAFQEIIGFQNTVFNNTAYKFVNASRRQAPDAGRNKYLGNVFSDISEWVFYHAKLPKGGYDPNAEHFEQGDDIAYETNAYARNIFRDIFKHYAVFEAIGKPYDDFGELKQAMADRKVMGDLGKKADSRVLRNPEGGDFQLAAGSPALDNGAVTFVPWSLYGTVGEWHFLRNEKDPARVMDEHWYMESFYHKRNMYKDTPRYPLMGRGLAAEDYVDGPLENWTAGALELDGTEQYLAVEHQTLAAPFATEVKVGRNTLNRAWAGDQKRTVDMQENSFLIEAYLKTQDSDGVIARKADDAGYSLELQDGRVVLRLVQGGRDALVAVGPAVAGGRFHHLVAEVDREQGVRIYVDGRLADAETQGEMPTGSLSNEADFLVGGGPGQEHLAATFEFLRVSRGTLADARTSIQELYAWQFHGPQFRDFVGKSRGESPDAGALEQQ